MIRNPINVYPYNNPIDSTQATPFSFTFTGDKLTNLRLYIFSSTASTPIYQYVYQFTDNVKYNGDEVEFIVPASTLLNNQKYRWYMELSGGGETFSTIGYYFETYNTPTFALTINNTTPSTTPSLTSPYNVSGKNALIEYTYFQAQGVSLKSYNLSVYNVQVTKNSSGVITGTKKLFPVFETGNVYRQDIHANLTNLEANQYYQVEMSYVTQKDQIGLVSPFLILSDYSTTTSLTVPPEFESLENENAIKISWIKDKFSEPNVDGSYSNAGSEYPSCVNIPSGSSLSYDTLSGKLIDGDPDNFGIAIKGYITEKTRKIVSVIFTNKDNPYSVSDRIMIELFCDSDKVKYQKTVGGVVVQTGDVLSIMTNSAFVLQSSSATPITNTQYFLDKENTDWTWNADSSHYYVIPTFNKAYVFFIEAENGTLTVTTS